MFISANLTAATPAIEEWHVAIYVYMATCQCQICKLAWHDQMMRFEQEGVMIHNPWTVAGLSICKKNCFTYGRS